MIRFLFSSDGRMSRLGYLGALVVCGVVIQGALFLYLWSGLGNAVGGKIAVALACLISLWVWTVTTIKRLHDAGFRAFWALPGLFGLGWIISTMMLFWPGERVENRFGTNPRST
ncbi:DUF805 domain-containing protein [Caulobacter segnis]|uniref:DUF805 domain-containing protein n=1 Tax=Caulobacter segnis TaxID=88688 RepID=UPI00240F45D5|nr:DUF805 domain-containing protein [Caulobacter segnis]MDG2522988.1 DUF805 domain-containing protein [Caulobacter segnis]